MYQTADVEVFNPLLDTDRMAAPFVEREERSFFGFLTGGITVTK